MPFYDGMVFDKIQVFPKFKLKYMKAPNSTDLLTIQHTARFEQYLGELAYMQYVVPNRKSDDLPFNRKINYTFNNRLTRRYLPCTLGIHTM